MSEVKVIVSLASGAVQTGLTKIRAQFSKLRSDLNSELGSFLALGGVIHIFDSIIEKATKIANVSKRFGFGGDTKELQRISNAAKDVADIEDVARVMNKLAVNQQKAKEGNDEMRKSFEKLGIPMKEVANMSIDELFYRIADATASAEDRGKAYAAVVALGGRNAGILFSTLQKGSTTIKAQGDAMGIMADKTVENLHKMHMEIEKLKQTIFVYGGSILMFFKNIAESIGAFIGSVVNFSGLLIDALKETGALVKSLVTGDIQNFDISKYKASIAGIGKALKLEIAGAGKQFQEIWTGAPEHVEGPKKPIEVDVESTDKENAAAEKLVTLREQLAEIQRKSGNDELTIQEKINALVAQRAALLKEAAGTKDEEKHLQLEIDAAKVNDEITAAVKERTRYIEQGVREQEREEEQRKRDEGQRISANSLRRIGGQETGGFAVGGIDDKLLREQTAHRKILTDIEKNTRSDNKELIMR